MLDTAKLMTFFVARSCSNQLRSYIFVIEILGFIKVYIMSTFYMFSLHAVKCLLAKDCMPKCIGISLKDMPET